MYRWFPSILKVVTIDDGLAGEEAPMTSMSGGCLCGKVRYKVARSSGQVIRRHFCPNRGSSIFGEPYRPGMINLMAGTLDDPSVFVPTAEVFCDYAFSWLYDGGERPHLPRGFG
jgi:hypothetical protein